MVNWGTAAQGLQPRFTTIVDPEAPSAYRALYRRLPAHALGGELAGIGMLLAVVLIVPIVAGVASGPVAMMIAFVGVLMAAAAGAWLDLQLARDHVVSGVRPRYRGRPIVGEGLDRLTDLSQRFAFARRKIDELPDLIRWEEIEEAVEAIRFDAARHAAALSETEARWADVRHAPANSPQAVLKARLARQRSSELEILKGYQRTADRLMNRAADAVAAATIAADLGHDLELALASPAAAEANVRLEAAIDRLEALTEAWRALDASTDLRAAALAIDHHERDEEARRNAARLMARLGEVGDEPATPADDGEAMG